MSPISAETVAQGGVRLSAPWIENGVLWWLEGRAAEAGRSVLVRLDPGASPVDVVPEGFNVRTSVHEYGGGAYCIHDGVAFVSGFDDQRLFRVEPGGEPVSITPDVTRGATATLRARDTRRVALDRRPRAARRQRQRQ